MHYGAARSASYDANCVAFKIGRLYHPKIIYETNVGKVNVHQLD